MFDYCIFFFSVMLVHMSVIYACCHPFSILSLVLTDKRVSCVLVCSSIFDYSKKCVKESVLSFASNTKCAKTFEMLTVAFGESTMSRTQVQLWYNWFKKGPEDVNDDVRLGHLSTSTTNENIEAVKKMIFDNRRITIRDVADDVVISFGSCQAIFTDVWSMKHVTAKIVPKQRRMDIVQEMLTTFNDDQMWRFCSHCFLRLQ